MDSTSICGSTFSPPLLSFLFSCLYLFSFLLTSRHCQGVDPVCFIGISNHWYNRFSRYFEYFYLFLISTYLLSKVQISLVLSFSEIYRKWILISIFFLWLLWAQTVENNWPGKSWYAEMGLSFQQKLVLKIGVNYHSVSWYG